MSLFPSKCFLQNNAMSSGGSQDSVAYIESDLDISIGSIPLLDQTPLIIDALETPNLSQNSAMSYLGSVSEISDAICTTF